MRLVDVFCGVDRPASIFTWKRNPKVHALLAGLGTGEIILSHESLDAQPPGLHREHLRSVLTHHALLPARDSQLSIFEQWLPGKLDSVVLPAIRTIVERFSTWHHLRRIRAKWQQQQPVDGSIRTAKQEITEVVKFLVWLAENGHSLSTCGQEDLDLWIATGPTTRTMIRTFIIWATKNRHANGLTLGFRQARTVRLITQDDRLAWLRTCLEGHVDSLAYRIAAVLLLLYAQPLVPIAALGSSPWLFPSTRVGQHLHSQTLMHRLRALGIDLLGSRNTALRELVREVPPPIVAELLGYSTQVTLKYATGVGEPLSRYGALVARGQSK